MIQLSRDTLFHFIGLLATNQLAFTFVSDLEVALFQTRLNKKDQCLVVLIIATCPSKAGKILRPEVTV